MTERQTAPTQYVGLVKQKGRANSMTLPFVFDNRIEITY